MQRTIIRTIAWGHVALAAVMAPARQAHAQSAEARYATMAPIEQYLMDHDAEIALARSAAPPGISRDATILVLGRKGYETAAKGTNGFVCVVERSWLADFDDAEFWNPKIRGANCYNPPAAQSIFPVTVKQQHLALAGLSKAQIADSMSAAFAKNQLPLPAPGSMAYMMAKNAYLNDRGNLAHVMFFLPLTDEKVWSASLPGSQFIASASPEERSTTLIVPVGRWSDGTAAPTDLK
jgi:hypothetical protein